MWRKRGSGGNAPPAAAVVATSKDQRMRRIPITRRKITTSRTVFCSNCNYFLEFPTHIEFDESLVMLFDYSYHFVAREVAESL
jgi:hypothetical protein